jgi:uncharacterized protein
VTNFIPIFPLSIVTFPTEIVNLHIFEPRYKQLIHECFTQTKPFGMPIVIQGKVQEFGTLMMVQDVVNKYANGEMDIQCVGMHTFSILEIVQQIPDKLYGGAIVTHMPAPTFAGAHTMPEVLALMRALHIKLQVSKQYKKPETDLTSFDIGHHIGLPLQNEYELLCIPLEWQRLAYLSNFLKNSLLTLEEQRKTIDRIQLNGHFRNLSLDDFDFKYNK